VIVNREQHRISGPGSITSLDSAQVAIDRTSAEVSSEVSQLTERAAGAEGYPALADALTARAQAWRAVARFSFEDSAEGDLLGQAALEAACLDDLFARGC
jgi:hypothetical protein